MWFWLAAHYGLGVFLGIRWKFYVLAIPSVVTLVQLPYFLEWYGGFYGALETVGCLLTSQVGYLFGSIYRVLFFHFDYFEMTSVEEIAEEKKSRNPHLGLLALGLIARYDS